MKKCFIFFTVLLLSETVLGQNESGFGLKAGVSNSNIQFKHERFTGSGTSILSPVFGFVGHTIIKDKFRFTSDISFSIIGTNYTDTVSVIDYSSWYFDTKNLETFTDELRAWNFSWYLLPEFRFTNNFFITAGPQIDFIINKRVRNDESSMEEGKTAAARFVTLNDDKNFHFAFCIGAGASIKNFRFDIRYSKGFTNMGNKSSSEYYEELDGFNKATYTMLQFSTALIIPNFGVGTSKTYN